MRVDPRLSPAICSQDHVDQPNSGLQATDLSPTDLGRLSQSTESAKNRNGASKAKTSTYSSQDLAKYCTEIGPSNLWSDTPLDAGAYDTNRPISNIMVPEVSAYSSTANFGLWKNNTSSQELPNTAVSRDRDNLNGDLGLD